jgi:hypothetical protein
VLKSALGLFKLCAEGSYSALCCGVPSWLNLAGVASCCEAAFECAAAAGLLTTGADILKGEGFADPDAFEPRPCEGELSTEPCW